jgi:hypothetical protein
MLTINGSFILHEDYPSQEQMDANVFFVVDFLKETINSNLKHDFDIFSNRTNKVTTILASEYQEELKGDYLISFCYSSYNDTKDYFEKLKNYLKDILESLAQTHDIGNGYFNIVFDGVDEKDKTVHLEDLVKF